MTEGPGNIQRLQMIEQNVQGLNVQKQQFQAQMFEVESALKELETSTVTYKIIAGVMIGVDKEKLKKELSDKKDVFDLRIQTLEKQEAQLKEKAKSLQQEVMKE